MSRRHHAVPEPFSPSVSPRANLRRVLTILLLGAVMFTGAQLSLGHDNAKKFLASAAAGGLTTVLLVVWYLFLSGLSRAARWRSLAGLLVLAGGFLSLVRLRGCTGDNHPDLVWRWGKRGPPPATLPAANELVDLAVTTPDDWPQFLGRRRDGEAAPVKLARDWDRSPPKELWRQPIGQGWSSFAVVGDYAVTQEQRGDEELVVCYRKLTGEICWRHADKVSYNSTIGGNGPRSTPTIHEGLVYTLGAKGLLNCLDGATGRKRWSEALLDEKAEDFTKIFPEWGKSCSPLVVGNLVVVSTGRQPDRSLEAYDRLTGKRVWSAGAGQSSYDSPTLMTLAGVEQLVIVNQTSVDAHDPTPGQMGRLLWSYDWPGNNPKVPQPVAIGANRLLIAAGYGVGSKLLELKHAPSAEGVDHWTVEQVWESRQLKPKFTNPLVRDGYAYGLDDGLTLVAIDLATGKRAARGGRYGHGQVIGAGTLLLIQAESGAVALIEPQPNDLRELTRFQPLAEKTWNIPTLAGRYLLVRNDQEAACYELPLEP